MTDEAFWQLIGRAAEQRGSSAERGEWLSEELTRLPTPQIGDFHDKLTTALSRADSAAMWTAAGIILDGYRTDDTYWSFRLWLLSLGQAAFDRAAAAPDTLADVPELQALAALPMSEWPEQQWPEWAALADAAPHAHLEVTGRELAHEDVERAPVDTAARFTSLYALFRVARQPD